MQLAGCGDGRGFGGFVTLAVLYGARCACCTDAAQETHTQITQRSIGMRKMNTQDTKCKSCDATMNTQDTKGTFRMHKMNTLDTPRRMGMHKMHTQNTKTQNWGLAIIECSVHSTFLCIDCVQ